MLPVEIVGIPSFALRISAWVPLPAPGAPSRINFKPITHLFPLIQEAIEVQHEHLVLHLLDGIQGDAHHDDDRCAADGQGAVPEQVAGDNGRDGHHRQVESTKHGDLIEHLGDKVGGGLAGTEAGDEAAVLLQVVITMKRLAVVTLLVVMLMGALVGTVNAATESELLDYLSKEFTVAGEKVSISEADKVKIERYLNDNEVTAEQADSIIAKVNEVIAIMDEAGETDLTKLSQEDKNKIISIANSAAEELGLTLSYDASSKTLSVYKDGKLIESSSIVSNDELVQTGSANYVYVAILAVAVIAIAAVVVKRARANA